MATPQRLPEFVDGYTYAKALNEGLTNDGLSAVSYTHLDVYKRQVFNFALYQQGVNR